jgi:very-short-patch-repair endonuclease
VNPTVWAMDLRALEPFARNRRGLIAWPDARRVGLTRSAWYRAHATGALVEMFHDVSRLSGYPVTAEQKIQAAVMSCGVGALASHRSAAALWGVEIRGTDPVDVAVPHRGRSPARPGVALHRPRDIVDLRPTIRLGIPSANPLRILVDLGAVAPSCVSDALEHFVVRGFVSRRAVVAALVRHRRPGRPGVRALQAALDAWALGDRPPDSVLEPRMAALIRSYGLPAFVFHLHVGRFIPDFAWPLERVIAEVDGWDKYTSRGSFEAQMARDAELQTMGWVVIHFTWMQVVRQPELVARRLAAALAARR